MISGASRMKCDEIWWLRAMRHKNINLTLLLNFNHDRCDVGECLRNHLKWFTKIYFLLWILPFQVGDIMLLPAKVRRLQTATKTNLREIYITFIMFICFDPFAISICFLFHNWYVPSIIIILLLAFLVSSAQMLWECFWTFLVLGITDLPLKLYRSWSHLLSSYLIIK